MDLNKLKGKLKTLQEGNNGGEKKDYSLTTFKPPVGKTQIRILPWNKSITQDDFLEIKFYYNKGKKQMISPLTYGEKDPINIFVETLKAKDYTKENFWLMKQLEPKIRTFLPVIVRGEESKGVRFWQFGVNIYEDLVALALDEETTGFEDPVNGRDFTVEVVDKKHTGTGYNSTKIRPRLSTTPLSKDPKLVELWLNNQPDPLEEYKHCKFTFDQIKAALGVYLTPEEDAPGKVEEEVEEVEAQPIKMSPKKQNPKAVGKADAFDKVFDEVGDSLDDSEPDDLPF